MSVLKGLGGSALTVMKSFIRQRCACVIIVIHSLDTVGSAKMKFDCIFCEIDSINQNQLVFCPRCRAVFRRTWR